MKVIMEISSDKNTMFDMTIITLLRDELKNRNFDVKIIDTDKEK